MEFNGISMVDLGEIWEERAPWCLHMGVDANQIYRAATLMRRLSSKASSTGRKKNRLFEGEGARRMLIPLVYRTYLFVGDVEQSLGVWKRATYVDADYFFQIWKREKRFIPAGQILSLEDFRKKAEELMGK